MGPKLMIVGAESHPDIPLDFTVNRQDLERGLQDYLARQSDATGDLAPVVVSRLAVESRIRVAEKWWQRATANLADLDLAYICAYTALLDACAAVLISLGYRSRERHATQSTRPPWRWLSWMKRAP